MHELRPRLVGAHAKAQRAGAHADIVRCQNVLIALVGQLVTDLSYGIVDPRVRVNK